MNIWRCQKEESKLLTLKGLPVWSGETDTSKSVEGTLSTSAGVSAMEEIGQRCQGWSGRASWRGRRLSQAQEGRERAALRTSKCWEEGAGTGAYKEGPCRWAWEAQGGRCGWSQWEVGVGSEATAVREAERAGPCEPQATPILTLCEAWAIGELGGGGHLPRGWPFSKGSRWAKQRRKEPFFGAQWIFFLIIIFGLSNFLF